MKIQPYLFFDGRCEEAVEFYKRALGAEVTALIRFKDGPPAEGSERCTPGTENKIMHAALRIGETILMASDGQAMGNPSFHGFSLSLDVPNDAEAERLFAALVEGGQVRMPLDKTFFSTKFGIVADRLGVSWMIVVVV
jgi:PhnB protein